MYFLHFFFNIDIFTYSWNILKIRGGKKTCSTWYFLWRSVLLFLFHCVLYFVVLYTSLYLILLKFVSWTFFLMSYCKYFYWLHNIQQQTSMFLASTLLVTLQWNTHIPNTILCNLGCLGKILRSGVFWSK